MFSFDGHLLCSFHFSRDCVLSATALEFREHIHDLVFFFQRTTDNTTGQRGEGHDGQRTSCMVSVLYFRGLKTCTPVGTMVNIRPSLFDLY